MKKTLRKKSNSTGIWGFLLIVLHGETLKKRRQNLIAEIPHFSLIFFQHYFKIFKIFNGRNCYVDDFLQFNTVLLCEIATQNQISVIV